MSSTQYSSGVSPRFVYTILIPVVIICFIAFEIWAWLQRNGATLVPWAIGVAVLLVAVGLTWAGWRVRNVLVEHKRVDDVRRLEAELLEQQVLAMKKHNELTDKGRLMLEEARVNRDHVEIRFGNNGAILGFKTEPTKPLQGRVVEELREQLLAMQTQQQLPAPADDIEIPDVVNYDDVSDEVPNGMSLLGIHPADGSLELTNYERLKCLWIVGSSSSGKSNTVFGKVREAVEMGAKLLPIDQHAEKDDSLARKLAPYQAAFLRPVAVSDEEVLATLAWFKEEFEARVHGAPRDQKIVLVVDEMNRMNRNDKLRKALQEIVYICGEEARGFGMYGWFISQKCVGLKWLRDSAITVIVHKLTRFEEALLACNDDRRAAKQLLTFKIGRTFVYGVDFDEPMVLQQALYHIPVVESAAYSSAISERSECVPTNQAVIVMERPQESAQEADGTTTVIDSDASSFELKKILNEIAGMKAKGMSNAAILKRYNLNTGGRNNVNLSALIEVIGDDNVAE
jgi:hypothetical protein